MYSNTQLDSHLDEIYASSYSELDLDLDENYARIDVSYETLAYKHYA